MKKAFLGTTVGILMVGMVLLTFGSCSKKPNDAAQTGYWTDADVQTVCQSFLADGLASIGAELEMKVSVGVFRNEGSEQIDTAIITAAMKEALADSGLFTVTKDGADFILQGTVSTTLDRIGGNLIRTYNVSAELVIAEAGVVFWRSNSEIKKAVPSSKL